MKQAEAALLAARAVESGLPRLTAPGPLAEKLVQGLPEIFGGAGTKLTNMIAHNPEEVLPVLKIVRDYQVCLEKFGLTGRATVNELFQAAKESGLELSKSSKARGIRSSYSSGELPLDEGYILKYRSSSTRHGADSTTSFLNESASSELSFTRSRSRMHNTRHTWSIRTPGFEHYTERHGW